MDNNELAWAAFRTALRAARSVHAERRFSRATLSQRQASQCLRSHALALVSTNARRWIPRDRQPTSVRSRQTQTLHSCSRDSSRRDQARATVAFRSCHQHDLAYRIRCGASKLDPLSSSSNPRCNTQATGCGQLAITKLHRPPREPQLLGRKGGLSGLSPDEIAALDKLYEKHPQVQQSHVRTAFEQTSPASFSSMLWELQCLLARLPKGNL